MNFLNLQYFVMAADEGNITHAAEKLNISQQSLSNHIANLEKEFNVELFTRKPTLALTYAGEQLYRHAVQILDIHSRIENEMKDISKHKNGMLRVGISYTRGRTFLPDVIPVFKEHNPFMKLNIVESNSQSLEEALLRGYIDLYIGTNIPDRAEFTAKRLTEDKFYLVVPKNIMARLYGEKEAVYAEKFCHEVALEDFAAQPFVLLSRENRIRNIVENYTQKHNIQLDIQLEMENIETLFALACRGVGITVYPETFLKSSVTAKGLERDQVYFFPLNESFGGSTLSIAYNNQRYLTAAAKEFIGLAKEACAEHGGFSLHQA